MSSWSWWQWSPRGWSWAGAAQDSVQDQPQQEWQAWSAASWSWAAAAQDQTEESAASPRRSFGGPAGASAASPRRSFGGPAGAAGPTGAWAHYRGGTARAPRTLRDGEPGQGATRARRVGNPRRLLRNYVRVMWRKVQEEYKGCLEKAEIFDVQSWAEKFLTYEAYLERHGQGHKASSNLGHTPPQRMILEHCPLENVPNIPGLQLLQPAIHPSSNSPILYDNNG